MMPKFTFLTLTILGVLSVAAAYLLVLALFGGGLAYLLYLDTQANARREAALREQEDAIAMMREQGALSDEAAKVLQKDLKREKRGPKKEPKGLEGPIFAEDDPGNRFERRQGREAAKKARKKKQGKRKASRPSKF